MKIDVASITANLSRDLSRIIDGRFSDDAADAATVIREWCAALDDAAAVKALEVILIHCVARGRHWTRVAASDGSESDDAKQVLAAVAESARNCVREIPDELVTEIGRPLAAQFPDLAERLSRASTTTTIESENQS